MVTVGIQSAKCIKSPQENIAMLFENSSGTTGRLVRVNANTSCESDGNDNEVSLEFGGSISPFKDMESESILLKTNISAQTSSGSHISINARDYIESKFQWREVSRPSSRSSCQHRRSFLQCAAQICEKLEMARKARHRVVQAK